LSSVGSMFIVLRSTKSFKKSEKMPQTLRLLEGRLVSALDLAHKVIVEILLHLKELFSRLVLLCRWVNWGEFGRDFGKYVLPPIGLERADRSQLGSLVQEINGFLTKSKEQNDHVIRPSCGDHRSSSWMEAQDEAEPGQRKEMHLWHLLVDAAAYVMSMSRIGEHIHTELRRVFGCWRSFESSVGCRRVFAGSHHQEYVALACRDH
jgi:hypothetical protein